jgi:hypothetical protein
MVSPVPVHPDIDSKKADNRSIGTPLFSWYGSIRNGMVLMRGMNNHPSAAVTIALLKFAGSACWNVKNIIEPRRRNRRQVMRRGNIA